MAKQFDRGDFRARSLDTWRLAAPVWESERERLLATAQQVSEWLVRAVAPEPGQTLLEVAAGPGDTGFTAARMLGADGRLISTDFAPEMVDVARRRAAELGVSNVEFRVMDAERMDLADDAVDGVMCRWGYMLMADPQTAFIETRRVLRPGGRLAFSVWAPPSENPWTSVPGRILVERGWMAAPRPGEPGMFSLAERASIETVLTRAGFEIHSFERVPARWRYRDFDDYLWFLSEFSGSSAATLRVLSEQERAEFVATLRERVEPFRTGTAYDFPGMTNNVLAT